VPETAGKLRESWSASARVRECTSRSETRARRDQAKDVRLSRSKINAMYRAGRTVDFTQVLRVLS